MDRGWCSVETTGTPSSLPEEHAVAQALVVVENIEAVGLRASSRSLKKARKLKALISGKTPKRDERELVKVKGGENFERILPGEKILLLPEEIQIFHRVDDRAVQKQGPGGAHDDMDLVPQLHQLVGQIRQVNSLSRRRMGFPR